MGFIFSGIFANARADVLEDFRQHFGGIGRLIQTPFVGFGVRLLLMAADWDGAEENEYATALINFSERHPATTFVYLYAECFGGPCLYAGFVFRGGERVHDEPFRDVVEDYAVLSRLLAHLGVETGGYFEPLERHYFDETPPARKPRRSLWARLFGG